MRRLIAKVAEQGFNPLSFTLTVIIPAAAVIVLGTAIILATAPAGVGS